MVWFVEYIKEMNSYWVYAYKSGAYVTIAYDDSYSNILENYRMWGIKDDAKRI